MSTDKERMEMLLAHLKMNPNELAKSLGYSRTQRIYFVLGGRNGISESLARDICSVYDEISFDWLNKGKGEMFKAAELPNKSSSNKIGNAIGSALAGTVMGTNVTAMAAMPSLGIGGFFGSIISSIFGSKDDITEEEAVEVLREVLEDSKRKDKEIEELKDKVEYWQEKANNLEYEMSKTKAG